MQLDFGEREPQEMEILPGYDLLLGLWLNGGGPVEEKAYTRLRPPSDEELLSLMKKASVMSKGPEEGTGFPVYIAQRLVQRESSESTIQPIALFYGGMIEEYCRPPWRKGPQL